MPGPPLDVPADELFRELCATPSPNQVFDYPRRGVKKKVRIFVLDVDEHQAARLSAHKHLKDKKYSARELDGVNMREIYGDLVARFLLTRAVRAEKPIPGSEQRDQGAEYAMMFPDLEAFKLAKVTSDEITVLFTMYQTTQTKFGPYEYTIENEHQLTAWIDRLVLGASSAPLARCDWRALVESNMLLARRAFILSAALESQRSTLPPTLVSTLDALALGTCSYGELPAKLTETGLVGTGDWALTGVEDVDLLVLDEFDEDVKQAAAIAMALHKHGE